jgi:hypothetical protein
MASPGSVSSERLCGGDLQTWLVAMLGALAPGPGLTVRSAQQESGPALSSRSRTARHVFVKPSLPIGYGLEPVPATRQGERLLCETQPRLSIIQYFFCADLRVVLDRRLRWRWA